MRTINDYEIVDHGIAHPDYFQGCGIFYTDFEYVATGIGMNFNEAVKDALDSLAQADWDVENFETYDIMSESVDEDSDAYYYVSIRVK